MSRDYEEDIRNMVSEILEVPAGQLSADTDFFIDLDIDSLKAIEIVAAFERRYRIIIPEVDIPGIRTLSHLLAYAGKSEC